MIYSFCLGINRFIIKSSRPTVNRIRPALKKMPKSAKFEKAFIIGGGQIYKQAMLIADEMILSFMKFEAEGEVKFPEIKNDIWKRVSIEDREQFEIIRYVKING